MMEQRYTSGGQASGMERLQACRFRPLHLLLVFACLSPVISTVPQVGDLQKVLFEAVDRDDAEGIEAAVHLGADLEAKNGEQMTALGLAAKEGRERAVSTLLRLGAEVEAAAGERGWSPLLWAVANRQNQTEALLRKAGAQPQKVTKEEAQDLLWKGVEEDDRLKIEGAFLSGADLEERRDKWTPLTNASYDGSLESVRALVRLGARLEGRGGQRQGTALHWATYRGHEAVVKELLEAGASLEAGDRYGETPLHWASDTGHLPIAKLLVDAGASVNSVDEDRSTPLHLASHEGHLPIARLLVEAGAEISPRNSFELTPFELALYNGHPAVAEYLRPLQTPS